MPSVGRTIKTLRVAAGLKQGIFANRVGITQTYLSALESDKKRPSLDLVEVIAKELNVPSGALLSFSTDISNMPTQYGQVLVKLQELQELLLKQVVSLAEQKAE